MRCTNLFIIVCVCIATNISVNAQTNTTPYPTTGNLGLGTLTPSELLDVNGNINVSNSFALKFAGADRITGTKIINPYGSASSPSYTFTNYTNTGIYLPTPNAMSISTNGTERMRFMSTGHIYMPSASTFSIGTTVVGEKLTVAGNIRLYTDNSFIGTTDNKSFFLRTNNLDRLQIKNNGTIHIFTNLTLPVGANIAIGKADLLLSTNGIRIHYSLTSNHAFIDYKDNLFFRTDNACETPLILQGNGAVAIGIASWNYGNDGSQYVVPSGFKLAVGGKIIAEELVIKLQSNWPDYVFSNDYKLMQLSDVESFIIENGHLPSMPNAEQIEENGVEVGEMNSLLLKKIEELTLYIIELNKEVSKLKLEIDNIQQQDNQ